MLAGEREDGLPEPEGFAAFDVDLESPQLLDELLRFGGCNSLSSFGDDQGTCNFKGP
jgi:hypothetical protein